MHAAHVAIAILFILICIMLIGIILLQKGRGGGLSGAFGGAGAHSAFGTRTGDTFTWITVALVGLFLVVAMVAAANFKPDVEAPIDEQAAEEAPAQPEQAPAATETAEPQAAGTPAAETPETPAAEAPASDEAPVEAPAEAPAAPADNQ